MVLHARYAALALWLIAASAVGAGARADEPSGTGSQLHWDPAWSHAGPSDYVLTGLATEDIVLYEAFLQPRQPALHWYGPILFDEQVRDLFIGASPGVRSGAVTVGWAIFGAMVAYPAVVDLSYAWFRYGKTVMWDLLWQDAAAMSLATAIDMNLRDIVGRARPQISDCLSAGGTATKCLGNDTEATRSFPGGHVAIVTTAAALTCTQHLRMRLFGPPWDAIVCGTAVSADLTVGTMRLLADQHYATDILTGFGLGVAVGWGLPTLMHLHGHSDALERQGIELAPGPVAVPHGAGLGVVGIF